MMLFLSCIIATACLVHGYCPNKPGICPKPTGPGTCVELCEDDSCCKDDLKCCFNGCGHSCQKPIPPPGKPGSCPFKELSQDLKRICEIRCKSDFDCPGEEKCCLYKCTPYCEFTCNCPAPEICCSKECGRECVKPVL